jgi:hypothetical protein
LSLSACGLPAAEAGSLPHALSQSLQVTWRNPEDA